MKRRKLNMSRRHSILAPTFLGALFIEKSASAAGEWFGQQLFLFPAAFIMLLLIGMVMFLAVQTAPRPLRFAFATGTFSGKKQIFTVLAPLLGIVLWISILAAGEFSLLPLFFPIMEIGYGLSSLIPAGAACSILILTIPIQYLVLGKFLDFLRHQKDHHRKARSSLFAAALVLTIGLCFTSSVWSTTGDSSRPAFEQRAFMDSVHAYALLGALLTMWGIRWRRRSIAAHATPADEDQPNPGAADAG
jgi:hypothetical protein